jgi:hypothetical protein
MNIYFLLWPFTLRILTKKVSNICSVNNYKIKQLKQ